MWLTFEPKYQYKLIVYRLTCYIERKAIVVFLTLKSRREEWTSPKTPYGDLRTPLVYLQKGGCITWSDS